MIIAIDYDDTYTADIELWDNFIGSAIMRGHQVVCVTARRETAENVEQCDIPGVLTYFTALSSKMKYMEKHGIKVDIWIDDQPRVVVEGF